MTRRPARARDDPAAPLLRDAAEELLRDYLRFLRAPADLEGSRLFAAQHAAGKAALAHLEALRKLGGGLADRAAEAAREALALVARAREETGEEDDPTTDAD